MGNKTNNKIQKMLKKYTDKNRKNDFKVNRNKSKPRFIPSNDSPGKDNRAVIYLDLNFIGSFRLEHV